MKKKILTKEKDLEKITTRLTKDLKKIKNVKSVVLFGSYCRGQQRPLSDIDICVITDKKISERIKSKIISMSSEFIDVSLFWELPVRIRYRVLKEGRVLLNLDNKFRHTLEVDTMSEYLDFKYIIDKNIERVFNGE